MNSDNVSASLAVAVSTSLFVDALSSTTEDDPPASVTTPMIWPATGSPAIAEDD